MRSRTYLLFGILLTFACALGFLGWKKHSSSGIGSRVAVIRDEDADTDSPDRAVEWRRLAWRDEFGRIPADGLQRALAQKRELARVHPMTSGDGWIEEGPADLSGRSCCMVIDPNSPQTIWQGSAGGGIWKSTDWGASWVPVGDNLKSLAVNCMTLDPNDKKTLYAGTGEGYFNADEISGFGIFKSTDGGLTWNQLPSTDTFSHVNRIAVMPGNSKVILATAQYGGIYRSNDGGTTWTSVMWAQSGHAVAFCPSNTQRVIGTIQDYDFGSGNWYASAVVSNDAGVTWKKSTGGLNEFVGFNRIETAPVQTDANTVFASVSDGAIWKSTDGGQSYSKVTTNGNSGASWYGNAIWVDPTNANRIVVGGVNVYGSTDGGVTLNTIGQGYIQTTQPHPDVHFFMAAPGYDGKSNKTLYVCTDGGLYVAPDITIASTGGGWQRKDQGARTTQYYSICGDGPSGRIVGGLQDNGTQSNLQGSNLAGYIFGGDGGFVAIDPEQPQYVYGEYIDLQIFRNNDGGTGGNVGYIYGGLGDAGSNANFIAPFILDPNQPQTLLAGGGSLWRTTNARASSPSWSVIRSPGSSLISAIAVAKGNSDVIWVGQNDGVISMTTNGTGANPTWTTISSGNPIPSRYVTRILIDPDNSNIVYATLGGFSSNDIWKTTNGGSTWVSITGSGSAALPQVPVRAIARQPGAPNTLYVGTEIGIFTTADGGQTWSASNSLTANVSVDDLEYMNNSNILLAGTHGRGVWLLPSLSYSISSLTLSPTSVVGGNSCTGTVTLSQAAAEPGVTVSLSAASKDAQVPDSVVVPAGSTTVTFNVGTLGVAKSETVGITATIGSSQMSTNVTLYPAAAQSVSVSPNPVGGGSSSTGTVRLNGKAGAGGAVVNLGASNGLAGVPSTTTVPSGSTSTTFLIQTVAVQKPSSVVITAQLGTSLVTTSLTVNPASLQSVTLNPAIVVGGSQDAVTGTVTLNGAAYTGGVTITLTSSKASVAQVPASVKIPAGSSSATFVATHFAATVSSSATIAAKYGTTTQSATLSVSPFQLMSLTVAPTSVIGGQSAIGTATLNAAPGLKTNSVAVKLSSSSKSVKTPASVSVPRGTKSQTFAITTSPVNQTTTGNILGILGSSSQQAALALQPAALASIAVSPLSVKGSSTTTVSATVTLTGPAPTGGLQVKLSSSNSAAASLSSSLTIPAGKSTAKCTVTHKKVSAQTNVILTATMQSVSTSATLTVTPG
ncbi:MAG: hypothetical protein P4L46_12405 [Fimbriimonas sp.]|nr:hypothetical protein [Fimbriimonas sp.]